jgi:hypothetical protein
MRSFRIFAGVKPLIAVTLVLALAFAGCGDDSDGTSTASDSDGTAAAESISSGSEEDQIAAVMRHLEEVYNDSDGAAFCASLTARGQREVVRVRKELTDVKSHDCAGIVSEVSEAVVAGDAPQRTVKVLRVDVQGKQARAVIKGGLAGIRSVMPFKLRQVAGEWKVEDPISARGRLIRIDGTGQPVPKD